ncbi:unnamed protein product [Spodoptera littoralis]|uniref:Uncharacterized protein n=1 Tax=Spodoptera littoralis TaxID=7109 RepID=A0A9P0I4J2_SPOLI|nr:unnamed protein product [Spodoptera littoralis]CAH1639304.1 unnamed protein product [Spodoptera littoralis]
MSAQLEKSLTVPRDLSFLRQADHMKRLQSLPTARIAPMPHNHQGVVAGQARNKLPPNYEAKIRQAEWLLDSREGQIAKRPRYS